MKELPYAEAVGVLLWLARGTRPDIAFAVGVFSRYTSNPGQAMWEGIKRVFRYLKGTSTMGVVYGRSADGNGLVFAGFTDADFAGDLDTRHSTSGYVFTINGAAVSWGSKKQSMVALSTTEAEYMAMCFAAKEAMWLRQLLRDLGYDMSQPTVIWADNQTSIGMVEQPAVRQRTKHIDVQYHYARERVEAGDLKVNYVNTQDNAADLFTKALTKDKTQRFAQAIGMV